MSDNATNRAQYCTEGTDVGAAVRFHHSAMYNDNNMMRRRITFRVNDYAVDVTDCVA